MVNSNEIKFDRRTIPIPANEKGLELKVIAHPRRPDHMNAFAISNDYGFICGGILRAFLPTIFMRSFDYPTLFKSRVEAREFLDENPDYLKVEMENALLEIGYEFLPEDEEEQNG